jgi:hypothetical protein
VAFSVENPVRRRISAVNDGSFADLTRRGNSAENNRFESTFTFTSIEAAVVRAGPEAPPATTRGGAV